MTAMTTAQTSPRLNAATIARHIARVLLGGLFTFASIAYFAFPPPSTPPPGNAGVFMTGLAAAGYLMPLLKVFELLVGLALLTNRFVPLALLVLAPISLNIFLVHAVLMPEGLPVAIAIVALQLFLAWAHRRAYAPLFFARWKPVEG